MTDDEILENPIIIIGAPRSGTTVLSSLLSQHPALHLIEEPRITWKYGNDAKSDMLKRSDARPAVREHIRKSFAQQVRAAGKTRLLEKMPSNSLRLEFVDEVLPNSRFVHIQREGAQSVLSIRKFWENHSSGVTSKIHKRQIIRRLKELKLRQFPYYAKEFLSRSLGSKGSRLIGPALWGPRLPGMSEMVRDLELLEVCAMQWRMCVEMASSVGRLMPKDRYMECRLENMSEDLLRKIMTFCNLDMSEEVLDDYRKRFDPSQPSRRTAEASPEDIELVRRWIAPTVNYYQPEG